jgi:hypothetical protein
MLFIEGLRSVMRRNPQLNRFYVFMARHGNPHAGSGKGFQGRSADS